MDGDRDEIPSKVYSVGIRDSNCSFLSHQQKHQALEKEVKRHHSEGGDGVGRHQLFRESTRMSIAFSLSPQPGHLEIPVSARPVAYP